MHAYNSQIYAIPAGIAKVDARHKKGPWCARDPEISLPGHEKGSFCARQPLPVAGSNIYRNIRCDKYCSNAGRYASETWMRAPPMEMS